MPGYDNGIKVTEESHAEVFRYKVMMSPTDFKWYGKKKKKDVCVHNVYKVVEGEL